MLKYVMILFRKSIRHKIMLGYYTILMAIISFSFITFLNLRQMENNVEDWEKTADFLDTALEIRRFEKNYFLYAKNPDYEETLEYVDKAAALLIENEKVFIDILGKEDALKNLNDKLILYKSLIEELKVIKEQPLNNDILKYLEQDIRSTGKEITQSAERISSIGRLRLTSSLAYSKRSSSRRLEDTVLSAS
ncbi:integral membrane sensor signal transduction histidine kinase [Candidatus Magnetoovum chiemensis]|nr:integral membrane sensor signal transduction histidine kinase [Candidatus Magnetoovum chiemensis]